jgi:hypothetical protein
MVKQYMYQHFSIVRTYKKEPNWDFWFETIPSGNPGTGITDPRTLRGEKNARDTFPKKKIPGKTFCVTQF